MKQLTFDKNRWIYATSPDNRVRYLLGEKGNNILLCIGVNPSTAEPDNLDATLKRVKWWTEHLGYNGWLMANLYPIRATDPANLPDVCDKELDSDNRYKICKATVTYNIKAVWAAWGATIETRTYLKDSAVFLKKQCLCGDWFCLGNLTKGGHPRHPLYLPRTAKSQKFDVYNTYAETM